MEVGLILGLLLSIAAAKKQDYQTSYACEGGQLHISCEDGYFIHLLRANYGRFSISICNEHGSLDWNVDCTSHRSYYIIHERCNLMSSCIVSATSEIFADPCPGTFKYLEVQYQCKLESFSTVNSSSSSFKSSTTSTTTRPPIIIPITRSTQSTVPPMLFNTNEGTFVKNTSTTITTTHFPIVILLPSEKSSLAKPTTDFSALTMKNFCQPVQSRGLSWNWTKAGTDAVQKCPAGTVGEAYWHCGALSAQWMPDKPDFSKCSSLWVDNLKNRVDGGDSVVNIAAELSVMTHRKPLYGGDVRYSSEILHRLVNKMRDKMIDIVDVKQRHQILQELFESSSDITSNLLEVSSSWEELKFKDRTNIASTLLEAIEQSGWLFASAHNSPFTFEKILPNLVISVQVLNVWTVTHVTFPSVEKVSSPSSELTKDSLHLPMQALLGTASNGLVKIVLASFDHVKEFLGSASNNFGIPDNSSSIINSKIISAFIGRYSGVRFPEPVTITFKLLQEENVTHPQCVYWDLDTRIWSRDGCWLKRSNKTHAICECDHLTNFAVLMKLQHAETYTEKESSTELVIYIGCGVSSVLFLLTAVLLHFLRSQSTTQSAIHKHLSLCLMLTEIIYIGSVDQLGFSCSILSGMLHFLLQTVFIWLLLSTFQLHILLEKSTYNCRISHYSVVAYSTSIIIVCVSAIVDPKSFGTDNYCFLQIGNYHIFSFLGPAAFCIVGSFLFLIVAFCKICFNSGMKSREYSKINSIRMRIRETLFVTLCAASCWTFLLLYMYKNLPVLAYLFATLNCLQGLAIFIFFGLHDSEVQKVYQKWKISSSQPKVTDGQFSPATNLRPRPSVAPYLHHSGTVSSLSAVAMPQLEFQMGTFHSTRSPIYDNREQLVI